MIITIMLIVVSIIVLAAFSFVLKIISASNSNHSSGGLTSSSSQTNMNAQVENKITSQIAIKNIAAKENGGYKYDVDLDAKIEEIYKELEKTTEGNRTLSYISGSEQEKKDFLKDMIRAEILTQYPDLRTVKEMENEYQEDEVQGGIKFKRYISEPTIKKIESMQKSKDTSTEINGGIVCYGDDFTLGNIENSDDNYPTKLADKLQKDTYNLGFSGLTSTEIALMAEAKGYTLEVESEDVKLAGEENSEVTISVVIKKDDNIQTNKPLQVFDGSDDSKILECTINNIKGQLIYKNGKYVFKRLSKGSEVIIKKDEEIKIKEQKEYSKSFPIIWMGNNNEFMNKNNESLIRKLISEYWAIINMSENTDDYIVIIPTHYRTNNGKVEKYKRDEYEKIKEFFLEESGFNVDQVLDVYDKIETGNEYDVIISEIENCLNKNNIKIHSGGDYTQNSGENIIKFSNEYLPSDGNTPITLEYIPLGNETEPSPGTLMWMINNDDVEIQKASMQYFSLDNAGNIIVSNWTKTTTTIENFTDPDGNRDGYVHDEGSPQETVEYNITSVKINYKSSVSNYTMPFDYLWTFLVMSEDTQFVKNLTNLCLDSKIEATLFDELTVVENDVVDEVTNDYKTKFWESVDVYTISIDENGIEIATYNPKSPKNKHKEESEGNFRSEDKKSHKKVVTETNKINYKMTYADIWCFKYSVDGIVRQENQANSQVDEKQGDESNGWEEHGSKIVSLREEEDIKEGDVVVERIKREIEQQDFIWVKDHLITTTITNSGYKYTQGTVTTKEKTDKDYTREEMEKGVFEDPNFVKYYLYASTARNNISSTTSWLFKALETNERTEGMVDITKYMLYKATGVDYGVTDFDFKIFDPTYFVSTGKNFGYIGWEFTKAWENLALWNYINGKGSYSSNVYISECITEDKKYYIMHDDLYTGNQNRNFGFGVCFYVGRSQSFQNQSYFKDEGINIEDPMYQNYGESKIEVEIADRVSYKIWNQFREFVLSIVEDMNVELEDYQIDALTDCAYQGYGNYIRDTLQVYMQYGLDESKIRATSGAFYSSGNRGDARWTLFSTGKYITADKQELDPNQYNTANYSVESVKSSDGHTYPHYIQYNYADVPYGTTTLAGGGCLPSSLAMILAGLLNDPSITPITVADAIKSENRSYYTNAGSQWWPYAESWFLEKHFGVKSKYPITESEALQALKDGYPVLGGEPGHYLVYLPVLEGYEDQGYLFYILDSAKGHDGHVSTLEEAYNRVGSDHINYNAIIYPPGVDK